MFTTDSDVLSLVADHDPLYLAEVGRDANSGSDGGDGSYSEGGEIGMLRPKTTDKDDHSDTDDHSGDTVDVMQYSKQRPFTAARGTTLQEISQSTQSDFTQDVNMSTLSSETKQNLILPHLPSLGKKSS